MSNVKRSYSIRFELENGAPVKAQMESIGESGEKSLKKLAVEAQNADQRLGVMGQTILKRVIPAVSGAVLAAALKGTIDDLSELNAQAKKLSITAEQLQELRYTAQQFGIDPAAVDSGFSAFFEKLGEAQQGVGELSDLLKFYNIDVRDAEGRTRSWQDVLGDLSGVVSSMGDEQEKMFLANKLGLKDFMDVLNEGPDAFKEYANEAHAAGQIINEELIKRAAEFDKAWDNAVSRFGVGFKSTIMSIAVELDALFKNISGEQTAAGQLKILEQREQRIRALAANPAFEKTATERLQQIEKQRQKIMSSPEYERESWDNYHSEWKRNAELLEKFNAGKDNDGRKGGETFEQYQARMAAAEKLKQNAIKLSEQEQQKIQSVIEALEFKTEQMGRDALQQEIHNQLRAAGVELYSEEGQRIAELVKEHHGMALAQQRNADMAKMLGDTIRTGASAWQDWRTAGLNALADIAEAMVNLHFGNGSGGGLGGVMAEAIYGLIGGGVSSSGSTPFDTSTVFVPPRKPGFATGGSFMVGGNGGTDTTPVSFWATRGERVTVETPAQQRAAAPNLNVTVINNSNAQVETRRSGAGGRDLEVVISESVGKSIATGRLDGAMNARFGLNPKTRK